MKLYHHKTDGGAEYLCTSPIEGTGEGDLHTAIIRLDGGPELLNPAAVYASELLETLKELVDAIENQKGDWMNTDRANHAIRQATEE